MREGRHPRERLIQAAWLANGPGDEALPPEVRDHLKICPECRQFFAEVKTARRLALSATVDTDVTEAETRLAVERAMRTAETIQVSAITEAATQEAPRREAPAHETPVHEAPTHETATPLLPTPMEKAGFALMALGILGVQALLAAALRPAGFVALEIFLNWMAPFTFYIIFRLNRLAGDGKEGAA